MPFSLSSPPPRLPCRLSLGKGEGSLATAGRSQVEAPREGKARLPNLHWLMLLPRLHLLPLLFLLPSLLLPRTAQIWHQLNLVIPQKVLGSPSLSWEPSAPVHSGSQKLFSCLPGCSWRQLVPSGDGLRRPAFKHPPQRVNFPERPDAFSLTFPPL